jgi:hypothetical protein
VDEDLSREIARLRAYEEIRQLACRYALAVDSRDLETLVELFVEDVDSGKRGKGRGALLDLYRKNDSNFRTTVHTVTNHVIDFDDDDHARGTVYCRGEYEALEDPSWRTLVFAYWDTYERRDGTWYFATRETRFWFEDAWAKLPSPEPLRTKVTDAKWPGLPESWPTWERFWQSMEE